MMDDAIRAIAVGVLENLPSSLEMPAGTGKTQLVAAMASVAAASMRSMLVLTHTHAGVDAIRRRLHKFGVSKQAVHVDTIAGWAFDLVRSYPNIAGITVPVVPDWTKSADYVAGAARVVRAKAIIDMHAASFDYLIVDEYQDCSVNQHQFIVAIADAIPRSCVLGDRLQGIFGFRGQPLVDWDQHVFDRFPLHQLEYQAWRWHGCNAELGEWLLGIRPALLLGVPLDLSTASVPGLTWVQSGRNAVRSTALRNWPKDSSVLVLGQWKSDADQQGQDLLGIYGVMEELQGGFMLDYLKEIDVCQSSELALVLARFAKTCIVGLGGIDRPLQERLRKGQEISTLKREGLLPVQKALDALQESPSLQGVAFAMTTIANSPGVRLYKREAWNDSVKALEACVGGEASSPTEALARIRDGLRHTGRRPSNRVVSRTVLVKGLEYDHVIVADADKVKDPQNLYVALTRGRYSVTVVGSSPVIGF